MRKIDLLTMNPGSELDMYIASHYMGFRDCSLGTGTNPETGNRILIPPYSRNSGSAIEFAEKTIHPNWFLVIAGPFQEPENRWKVSYHTNGGDLELQNFPFQGNNLAILICRSVIEIIEKE